MTRLRARRRTEEGATALLVGLMAVVLIGISAFTTDLGLAYVSKRQLQTASDSAALAAAGVYAQYPGTCESLADDLLPASQAIAVEAKSEADSLRALNRPGSTGGVVDVECGDSGTLDVTYESSGVTPAGLGQIFGVSDIESSRTSTATVSVPTTVRNLRPWGICSAQAPHEEFPSRVMRVAYPGNGHIPVDCPGSNIPGNWWLMDCPGTGGSTGETADSIRDGCRQDVRSVPDQPNPSTPTTLSSFLRAACTDDAEHCLSGDTGRNFHNSQITNEWQRLVGETIIVPIFCGDPTCAPAATVGSGGTGVRYPIYKFASVTVCGFQIKNTRSTPSDLPTGICDDRNLSGFRSDDDLGNNQTYFLYVFHMIMESGSTNSSECALGFDCDGGLRRVLITE